MSCDGFIQPLDFQCIFINIFSETTEIFITLTFIVLAAMAAYFRMNNLTFFASMVLFVSLMSLWVGTQIYLLVILIVGIVTFWGISNIIKK